MRVALCLSGLPRTFKSCYPSIKQNIIDVVNPTVFISTWNVINPPFFEIEGAVRYDSEGSIQELQDLYQPMMFEVENYNNEQKEGLLFNQTRFLPRKHPHVNVTRNLSMLYKIFKAHQLARTYEVLNNFRFDVIIKCRLDLQITNPIDLNELEPAATGVFFSDVIRNDGMISDILYFSSSEIMEKVCNKFWLTDVIYNYGVEFNIEKTLRFYLKDMLQLTCKEHTLKPVIIRPEHVKW